MKYIELTDETRVPALGLGTWQLEGDECTRVVREGLETGYRHVDTAQFYGNESEVGRAVKESGVDRDEVFLATKLWWEHTSKDAAAKAIDGSLERLGVDHVDLLMLHWPRPDGGHGPLLEAMSEAKIAGKARHLGVCNFTPELIDGATDVAPLVCNQVEYHPFLKQDRVIEACREAGLWVTAYSPLARGKVVDHPTLTQIGLLNGKSPTQIALRWLLDQDGVAAIPKASSKDHLESNLDLDFELTDNERETIRFLARRRERIIDPDWAPQWEPDEERVEA